VRLTNSLLGLELTIILTFILYLRVGDGTRYTAIFNVSLARGRQIVAHYELISVVVLETC
jgi:hypothetical protein